MVHLRTIESPLSNPDSVVEAFSAVALQFGDRIAVSAGDLSLTYAELETRSHALAARLIHEGIQPGEPVGVVCERSPQLIVALLAILKAGAAYLPFDASYPKERLQFMANDAGIKFVLGDATKLGLKGVTSLSFSDFPETVDDIALPVVERDSPAYLLYTSGSTGTPKGVLVPHRAILRLVLNADFAELGPETRILQHSPVAFDASTFEIWGPLLNGGQVILFPEETMTLRRLGTALRENEINTLWLTAGLFHAIVDERLDDLAGVTQLLAGGDVLSPTHAAKVIARFPKLALING